MTNEREFAVGGSGFTGQRCDKEGWTKNTQIYSDPLRSNQIQSDAT